MAQSRHRQVAPGRTSLGGDDLAAIPRGRPLTALVTLTEQERRTLGRRHPALAGFSSAVVVLASAVVEADVADTLGRLVSAVNERRQADVEQLVDEMLARTESLRPQFVDEAGRL